MTHQDPPEFKQLDRPGGATVRRYIDREHDALVAVGDFGPLFAAYVDHVRRWESQPDGLSLVMMRQGLGAAVLHLVNRPPVESVGWTIHVHEPATNLFLTGDAAEHTVTGRVYTEAVKPTEGSRMYVQVSREGRPPQESTVPLDGLDVLVMFEQFYTRSEQLPARFFEVTDDRFVAVVALPEANRDWMRGLTRESATALLDSGLRSLGNVTWHFQCGCTSERMMEVVRGLFATQPRELFHDEEGVEIYCPRCGRRWWVDRDEFEEPDEETGS